MEGRKIGRFLRLFVLLALTAALVFAIGTAAFSQETQTEPEKECYLAGDMNADGGLTSSDAVYLLYHTVHGEEQYPVNQGADLNGDGNSNAQDAIALLYAFYGWGDETTAHVGQEVHDYYDPAWTWTEDGETVTAQVTVKCACGEPETLDVTDITSDETAFIGATCAATGQKVYNARIEAAGQELTSTYTQTLPALPHQPGDMVNTDAAQHYQLCTVCDAKLNAENHAWEVDGDVVKGDCQTQSTQHYICDCGAEKTEQLGVEAHTYVYSKDILEDASNCTYAKQYECSVCQDTYEADQYTNHNYKTVVTQEATCQTAGEKASKCADCGVVRSTEEIPANNHAWVEGEAVNGIRTDTCSACDATKSTAVADGAVSKDTLQNSDELSVGDTTMSMDQDVKDNLDADRNVVINVEKIDKEEIDISGELTEEEMAQIGENQVYDFNMTYEDNGENVNFTGEITISLPYELAEGEDIDSIDVWYIADDGTLVQQEATYSNGYITFTTSHFSYYTVTRLTPRQRCERYGHFWTETTKTVTCTTDGYIGQVCQRCSLERNDEEFAPTVIPATGHDTEGAERVTVAATCVQSGSVTYKCNTCSFLFKEVIAPTGHTMQSEVTVEASCDAPGEKVNKCANCDHSITEVLPQLTHEYEHDAEQDVDATCTEGGYEIHVCKHCDDKIKKNEKPALGHDHHKDNAEWDWENAEDTPALKVSCSHEGCTVTKDLNPNVVETEASCADPATTTATAYYNGTKFEKSHSHGEKLEHDYEDDKWHATDEKHYRRCKHCGEQKDAAEHTMDAGTVTVEPTCSETGLKVYTCECGHTVEEVLSATGEHSMNAGEVTREPTCTLDGVKTFTCETCGHTEKESLPATGHSYVEDVCSTCGKIDATDSCAHINVFKAYYDLTDYGMCGGYADIYGCDCGQTEWTDYFVGDCDWEYVADHDYLGECWVCAECGATRIETWTYEETSSCTARETVICTLLDADGKEIVTFRTSWDHMYHDYQVISTVMYGATCEDGVTKTYTCATCGDSYTNTYYYHHDDRQYYALADYGLCGGWIERYVCACGIQEGADWYFQCDFVTVEDAEGKRTLYCEGCGTYMYVTYTEEKYNECITFYEFDAVLSNETMGEQTLSFGTSMGEHNHKWVYELTLLEGATSCTDGFTVKEYCTRCGDSWGEWEEYEHWTYIVDRELIFSDLLCGDVEKLYYSCACGQETSVEYSVEGCSYYYNGYDETLGCDTYLCEDCGTIRYTTTVTVPVEGIGCQKERITTYHYLRDGEEILTYERSYISYNHVYEATFTMLGETCDDGYTVHHDCIYCDYSYESGTYNGCQMFVVEVETKLNDEAYCTTVFQHNYSCPCGAYQRHRRVWNNNCSFEWVYNETLGREVDTCTECGLTCFSDYFSEPIDPEVPCFTMNGHRYTYWDKDGNELCVVLNDNRNESHTYLYTFEMLGTTCDDGYNVTGTCKYCGEISTSGTYYDCQSFLVAEETKLDDEAYCSTVYQRRYDCPCGACGEYDRYWKNNCSFESVYNEELDRWIYTCSECGLSYTEEWFSEVINPEKPCFTMDGNRYYYYDAAGNELCVVVNDWRNENHTYLYTFEMLGTTCDDGYNVTGTCRYCGETTTSGTYYGCQRFLVAEESMLDDEAYCSTVYQRRYDCPCGACGDYDRYWKNNCSFESVYNEEMDRWIYTCSECGLSYTEEWFSEVIDPEVPCYKMDGWRYTFYAADGNELCVVTDDWRNENHTYLYTFEKLGATCEAGYNVTGTCKDCGEITTSGTYYDCETWLISVEAKVEDEAYCSTVYQYNYDCPCGERAESDRQVNNNCSVEWAYNETLERWAYTCTTCGLTYIEESFSEVIDPEVPCYKMNGTRYTYYDVDGNELCVVINDWRNESHTYLRTFEMLGTTCEAGYNVTGTCKDCGKITTSGTYYNCQTWLISVEAKVEDEAYCSTIYQYNYSCPCGTYFHSDRVWTNNCSFNGQYNAILDRHVYTCTECGLAYTEEHFSEVIDPEKPCYKMNGWRYTYYDADYNQLCVVTDNWRNEEHVYLYTYQMQGTTCADGYSITGTCKVCDRSYTGGTYTGCETRRIERYDLTEYGMCGGYVDYYECGCGAYSNINYSMPCSYSWIDEYNDRGIQGRYCEDCNTTFYWGSQGGIEREECRTVNTYYLTVIRDGETVKDMTLEVSSLYHTMLMVGYEGKCGGDVVVYRECKYCGKEETGSYYSEGHGTHLTGFIDLEAGGACGGWISFYQCPCGERSYYSHSYNNRSCNFTHEEEQEILPDGNTLYKRTRTCSECGLVLYEEWTETRDATTCEMIRVRTIWARMGDEELGTFTERETYDSHRYGDVTYELLDPTKGCEDGLIGKQICLDCGNENTWRNYGHSQYKQSSIDLKQYGSVCGCELEYWACPCGKYQNYRLSDEACDLDCTYTGSSVEGAINEQGQYTTEGWNWFSNNIHVYTCAVTDPQCSLKVRCINYWLQEGCEAVRYQVWQLGYSETYDSTTGEWTYSWDEEIVIATGERRTYHSYEYTNTSETLDDGTTVYTYSYVCSTCGSSYVEKYQYKNGYHVGTECTAINLLDNGEKKQRTETWVNGFEHNDSFYRTYEKNAYIYADGTEYWSEYTYEYFVDGECKKVTTWKNSNGDSGSYESEHVSRYGKWIWEKYPTCSQPGVEIYEEYCAFCDELQYTTIYDVSPNGHNWYWDSTLEMYVCSTCGLENTNGADGTIILEDMTTAYGNDTNYVVGYYNQGNGEFTVYASVILVDSTDENNELILTGIEFTYLTVAEDGVCALSADQATIQAAAAAAMEAAGYTGTYAIRIAFVPVDSDGTLDYAITFDSQTAGGDAQ